MRKIHGIVLGLLLSFLDQSVLAHVEARRPMSVAAGHANKRRASPTPEVLEAMIWDLWAPLSKNINGQQALRPLSGETKRRNPPTQEELDGMLRDLRYSLRAR